MSDLFGFIFMIVILYIFYNKICKEMIRLEREKYLKEIEELEQSRIKNAKMKEYLDLLIEDKQRENNYRNKLTEMIFEEN